MNSGNQLDPLAKDQASCRPPEPDRLDLLARLMMEKLTAMERKLDRLAGTAPPTVQMLTKTEVARRLGCSRRTVDRRVRTGTLPAPVVVAGLLRWRADDLEGA